MKHAHAVLSQLPSDLSPLLDSEFDVELDADSGLRFLDDTAIYGDILWYDDEEEIVD